MMLLVVSPLPLSIMIVPRWLSSLEVRPPWLRGRTNGRVGGGGPDAGSFGAHERRASNEDEKSATEKVLRCWRRKRLSMLQSVVATSGYPSNFSPSQVTPVLGSLGARTDVA